MRQRKHPRIASFVLSFFVERPVFDAVILEMLSTGRYTPATYRGRPIELVTTFPYRFAGK